MLVHAALLALFACWVAHVHSNPARAAVPPPDPYEVLLQWLRANGAVFPHLTLATAAGDYRQVNAASAIPPNTIVLQVPHRLLMTTALARASPIGLELAARACEIRSTHTWLASMLLEERANQTSFWSPYINTLPKDYQTMPIHFEEVELDHLRGSLTVDKVYAQAEELLLEYDNLAHCYPGYAARFERDDFIWARLAVLTRIFGFEVNGVAGDGLVPMADMLNHRRPRETAWGFDDARNAFTITSLQPIAAGAEVYDSYGPKCNSRFFVNYGFALEHNEENTAIVTVELQQTDPSYWIKLRFLDLQSVANPVKGVKKFQVTANFGDASVKQLLSWARYAAATDADFRDLTVLDHFAIDTFEPVSIDNELAAIRLVATAASAALHAFAGGSSDDDTRLLARHKASLLPGGNAFDRLTYTHHICVVVRRGEKMVLETYVDLATHVPPLLMLTPKQLATHLPAFLDQHPAYADYVVTAVGPLVRAHAMRHEMRRLRHIRAQCRLSYATGWPQRDQLHPKCPAAPIAAAAAAAFAQR